MKCRQISAHLSQSGFVNIMVYTDLIFVFTEVKNEQYIFFQIIQNRIHLNNFIFCSSQSRPMVRFNIQMFPIRFTLIIERIEISFTAIQKTNVILL